MEKNRNQSKSHIKTKHQASGQSKTKLHEYASLMSMKSSGSGFLDECSRIMFKDQSIEKFVAGQP